MKKQLVLLILVKLSLAANSPCDIAPVVAGGYPAMHTITRKTSADLQVSVTASVTFRCLRGVLVGSSVTYCKDGVWLNSPPSCLLNFRRSNQPALRFQPARILNVHSISMETTTSSIRLDHIAENSNCRYGLPVSHSLCVKSSPELVSIEEADSEIILERHNHWRKKVTPPPKHPLSPLKWDPDLAEMAKRWAAQCLFKHTPNNERQLPDRPPNFPAWAWVGQNLMMAKSFSPNWTYAIDRWASERENWEYGKGQIGGGIIGHYTQIIWADTKFVGCGKATCSGSRSFMVCNYGPGGNSNFLDKDPYAYPYEAETSSSNGTTLDGDPLSGSEESSGSGDFLNEIQILSGGTAKSSKYHPSPKPKCRYGLKLRHSMCLSNSEKFTKFEKSSQEEIIGQHNYWRERVHPPAKSPLPRLAWDSDLATMAGRWAAQCRRGHDDFKNRYLPDRGVNGSAFNWVGQNICYSWGYSMTWTECIDRWAVERKDWIYGEGKVGKGPIGHYTQVIWADSLFVGCAKSRCDDDRTLYYLVCNYAPGGNIGLDGQDPYARPYQKK